MSAQQRADDAYRAYQAALQHAQNLRSDPTAAPHLQTPAQKSALAALDRAVAYSHAANAAVQQSRNQPAPTPTPPSGGGGGGYSPPSYSPPSYSPPPPPPPPPPRPPAWLRDRQVTPPSGVKQADPDIIITVDEPISPEFLIQTNYEDLAGMELINISRSDIIDGINVVYSPIKNLSSIRRRYNPNNIISMPELSSSYFSRFGIDLVLRGINKPFFDTEGNLIIEVDRVLDDELIEVEISDSGTINEVDFT